jgi:hypothetical protein
LEVLEAMTAPSVDGRLYHTERPKGLAALDVAGADLKHTKQPKLPQRVKFALELLYAGEQSELISGLPTLPT